MQTKLQSLLEANANTCAGLGISYAVSFVVYPALGMHGNAGTYALATLFFTVLSVGRNYIVRRVFNRFITKGTKNG